MLLDSRPCPHCGDGIEGIFDFPTLGNIVQCGECNLTSYITGDEMGDGFEIWLSKRDN